MLEDVGAYNGSGYQFKSVGSTMCPSGAIARLKGRLE